MQEEIVLTLDSFVELEAELEARKVQYVHYRDQLLSRESLERMAGGKIDTRELGDLISDLRTGLNPRSNFQLNTPDAKYNYITVRELRGMDILASGKTDKVNDAGLDLIRRRSHLNAGDVLFSGTGTIGNTALVRKKSVDWGIKEGVYALTPKPGLLDSKYLIYLMHSTSSTDWFNRMKSGGTVQSISMSKLKTMPVALPPLGVQKRVVEILDRFDALATSLTDGLPAEIAARRGQCEYYRDRLLGFPRKEA